MNAIAFVGALPLCTRHTTAANSLSRHSRRVQAPPARGGARMSLLADLVFKAVEVGVATYATTALSSAASAPTGGEGVNKDGEAVNGTATRAAAALNSLPAQVRELVAAAEAGVNELPLLLARQDPASRRWVKLAVCLALDLVGSGSLPVPMLADALDIVWAPLFALALHALFASPLVTAAGFAEEILPGTDGIPTATLAWVYEHYGDAINAALAGVTATDVAAAPVDDTPTRKRSPFGGAFKRTPRRERETARRR